jgi:flavin-dependent dehydrogenase
VSFSAEAAVIGAGPAGCSAAIFLAQRGHTVILVDKARFPRPKVCGEGVMPAGLAVLERLGVLPEVEREGRRFRGVAFTDLDGRTASGDFRGGASGLVLRRETLDSILLERAKTFPRIQVLEGRRAAKPIRGAQGLEGFETVEIDALGGRAPQQMRARQFLIADGALSPAAEALGLPRALPRRRRYGLRTHYDKIDGLGDKVEVFLIPGGEIYVAPQREPGTALVSLLLEEGEFGRFANRTQEAFDETLRACPFLKDRMRGSSRLTPILGLGPLGGRRERWSGTGWLLAGDAAGSVDPITGDGIAIALQNGELAAETIGRRLQGESVESTGASYERRRRALMRGKHFRAGFLLALTKAPPLVSRAVFAVLGANPALFSLLLPGEA